MSGRTRQLATGLLLLAAATCRGQELVERHESMPRDLTASMRQHVGGRRGQPSRWLAEQPVERAPREENDAPPSNFGMPLGGLLAAALVAVLLGIVVALMLRARSEDSDSRPAARSMKKRLDDLLEEGDRLRESGDHAGALRAYYLHALRLLRRLTGREEQDHLADRLLLERIPHAAVRLPFQQLSDLFQPIRYGAHPVPSRGVEEARDAAVAVRDALRSALAGGERP